MSEVIDLEIFHARHI